MIGNERRGDKSLLQLMRCRMVCYEHASRRCGGWQIAKPWRRHSLGAAIIINLIDP